MKLKSKFRANYETRKTTHTTQQLPNQSWVANFAMIKMKQKEL
jgi:hypothetical protein